MWRLVHPGLVDASYSSEDVSVSFFYFNNDTMQKMHYSSSQDMWVTQATGTRSNEKARIKNLSRFVIYKKIFAVLHNGLTITSYR